MERKSKQKKVFFSKLVLLMELNKVVGTHQLFPKSFKSLLKGFLMPPYYSHSRNRYRHDLNDEELWKTSAQDIFSQPRSPQN